MITVKKVGKKVKLTSIKCKKCESELEVAPADWEKGEYGSEEYIRCPLCDQYLLRPGTEYRGDF